MREKEYTNDSIRVRANEVMLNSKGFLLFAVDVNGGLEMVGDTTELSTAERRGLDDYRKNETI
jgi:hypothetical protein